MVVLSTDGDERSQIVEVCLYLACSL